MSKIFKYLLVSIFLLLIVIAMMTDGGKTSIANISCSEIELLQDSDRLSILLWSDGYLSAERYNTSFSEEFLSEIYINIINYCSSNKDGDLLSAITESELYKKYYNFDFGSMYLSDVDSMSMYWIDGFLSAISENYVTDEQWLTDLASIISDYSSNNKNATIKDFLDFIISNEDK